MFFPMLREELPYWKRKQGFPKYLGRICPWSWQGISGNPEFINAFPFEAAFNTVLGC